MDKKAIGWHHPTDESDQWDGFNEPGIEHFAGSPIIHLAREIVQNSCDAGQHEKTVKVAFHTKKVRTSEIPNLSELKANIKACLNASKKESDKAKNFFTKAASELDGKEITVLEIEDSNTKGMKGPSVNGTPYYAYVKARGQSKKEDSDASGSFGIGKFAPYAVSKLRTIFVSTVYEDEGKLVELTQGKSILMSHDINGNRKQGIGFWGIKEKCQPVTSTNNDHSWIYKSGKKGGKKELGSKINILGFSAFANWEIHLAVSVAENFFGSIKDKKLEVNINNKFILNDETIYEFIENEEIRETITKREFKGEPDQFNKTRDYLLALSEAEGVEIDGSEVLHLGYCKLRILVAEGLSKNVCVLRNGMFITDSLAGLKVFSDFKEFVAVVTCENKNGNELLRAMEPPRHDDFEPERLATPEQVRKGRLALKKLSQWIRESLKRYAKDPVSEVTEIDELRDFFSEEGEAEDGKSLGEINPYGKVIIRAKPITHKMITPSSGDSGEGGEEEGAGEGGGGSDGQGGGDGAGGTGSGTGGSSSGSSKTTVDLKNIRAILSSPSKRTISFTSPESGNFEISIKEAGADSDYDFEIIKANLGKVVNGSVQLAVIAGERTNIEVEFKNNFAGALKVIAHAI